MVNCDQRRQAPNRSVSESNRLPDFLETPGVTLQCPSWWAEAAQPFAQTIKGQNSHSDGIENDKTEAAQRPTCLIRN
jgi:hypothetical protein